MTRRVKISELVELTPKEANFVIEYTKDFDARRAAAASGYAPDSGYQMLNKENIGTAIDRVLQQRLENCHITAEWLLMEAVDNHMIARQNGNVSASNTALGLIGKHIHVDAFAKDKIDLTVNSSKEVMERLLRGRRRALTDTSGDEQGDEPISFM